MKPFDLKAALAGAPVVTVGGDPVTELHWFEGSVRDDNHLYGVHDGAVESWSNIGRYFVVGESNLDLRMAEGQP